MPIVHEELADGLYIPPQPELVQQIESAGSDLEKIAELISQDPGLSAAAIKAVNSAAFGLNQKIASITQAVVMLGMNRITNIIKTVLLRESMSKADAHFDMESFWRGSFSTAVAASTICSELNLSMSDEAYTLGLFHNCGIPVIAMDKPNYQEVLLQAYARDDGAITREEFSAFGVHHAAAGYWICRAWNLPEVICLVVKHHHSVSRVLDDKSIENPSLKTLICVLKMAEHMAELSTTLGSCNQDYEWEINASSIIDFLGISEYDYDDLKDAVQYKLDNMAV
jgi:HD-like signal output (HDOD) protein